MRSRTLTAPGEPSFVVILAYGFSLAAKSTRDLTIGKRPPPSVVVTAYQAGNGLVNLVTPTSAVVMGGLAIARVPYGTWIRFVLPVLVILAVLTVAVLALDVLL